MDTHISKQRGADGGGAVRCTDLLGRWKFVKPSKITSFDAWLLWEWRYKSDAGIVHGFRILGMQKEWLDTTN